MNIIITHFQNCEATNTGDYNEKTQCKRCHLSFSEVVCTHFKTHFDDIMPKDKKDKRQREMTVVENVVEKLILIMKRSPQKDNEMDEFWQTMIIKEFQDTHDKGNAWNKENNFLFEEAKKRVSGNKKRKN